MEKKGEEGESGPESDDKRETIRYAELFHSSLLTPHS